MSGTKVKETPGSPVQPGISVRDALRTALAPNTRAAYRVGWRRFARWCAERDLAPLEAGPEDLAEFVVWMASPPSGPAGEGAGRPLALPTIRVSLAAVNRGFGERNRDSPARHRTVANVLRGLARQSNRRPRRVRALRETEIARMLQCCDERGRRPAFRTIAARDGAVLAVGFAAALRRSEICALRTDDVELVGPRRMYLHIRRSKTDQEGAGERIAIPDGRRIRPVTRLRGWLALSRIQEGPVFQTLRRGGGLQGRPLHSSDVPRLVKRYVRRIGRDPAEYSGHSLRAGFVTSAAVHDARLDKIMEVTRHASAGTVLRYIRDEDAFDDHAGARFL